MTTGTIERVMVHRGFGFVRPDGEQRRVFFHRSDLKNCALEFLKPGERVTFSVIADRFDRPKAINIWSLGIGANDAA